MATPTFYSGIKTIIQNFVLVSSHWIILFTEEREA